MSTTMNPLTVPVNLKLSAPTSLQYATLSQEDVDFFKSHYMAWRASGYPDGDKAIIPVLEMLNQLKGVTTLYSCEGHAQVTEWEKGRDGEDVFFNRGVGRNTRHKEWWGFYLVCLVTQEGDRQLREIQDLIEDRAIMVKQKREWVRLPIDTVVLEHATIPAFVFIDGSPHPVPCREFRVNDKWPLYVKQRVLARIEHAVREVVKRHPG